jgi:hypothetical protein
MRISLDSAFLVPTFSTSGTRTKNKDKKGGKSITYRLSKRLVGWRNLNCVFKILIFNGLFWFSFLRGY